MTSHFEEEILTMYPLHYFASVGNAITLEQLLSTTDLSPFDMDPLHYWTPAHWAASNNHFECVLSLARFRAVDMPSERSLTTPLHVASELGHSEMVAVLLNQRVSVNAQDSNGDTALHKAAQRGNTECTKLLIDAGILTDTRNFYGRTASELAAMNCHFSLAALINQVTRIQKQEIQRPANGFEAMQLTRCRNDGILCKRSRDSLASVVDESLDAECSDKRLRFSDPVYQIAADLVGQNGASDDMKWQGDVQTSMLEHAAELRMADAYEEYYFAMARQS